VLFDIRYTRTVYFYNKMQVFEYTYRIDIVKAKVIPETGREGSWHSESSRLPHFKGSWLRDNDEVVGPTLRSPSTSGRFLVLISVRG
jgi:hypothetical protein